MNNRKPFARVYIYGDDFNLAGFAFTEVGDVVRPVGSFQSSGFIETTVDDMLSTIAADYTITELIVPPEPEGQPNKLLELMPDSYTTKVASTDPTYPICCTERAIALHNGKLKEDDYKGRTKLLERLRQVDADKPASALLWAYLRGLYELLKKKPSYGSVYVGGNLKTLGLSKRRNIFGAVKDPSHIRW